MSRSAQRAAATLALLLALASGPADAALASAPAAFSVSPSTMGEGETATVRVDPVGGRLMSPPGEFDLYIVWFSGPGVVFLTPSGQWSAEPVVYRAGLAAGGFAPVTGPLHPPARTLGSMPLGAIFTRPAGHPLQRPNWLYQPQLVTVRLKASLAGDPNRSRAVVTLGGLGLLSLGGCLLVLWRSWRAPGA